MSPLPTLLLWWLLLLTVEPVSASLIRYWGPPTPNLGWTLPLLPFKTGAPKFSDSQSWHPRARDFYLLGSQTSKLGSHRPPLAQAGGLLP